MLTEFTVNDLEEFLAWCQDQVSVVATGSKSLVEALCYSNARGLKITSLQAQNCGIAFLATELSISSALQLSIRDVRSLSFHAELVTNDTFTWDGSELVLPGPEYRQQELRRAITTGLLGMFISAAKDLEQLNVDLQCHTISSLHVEECDLINFLGNCCWSQLRLLRLRGIWTSEDQLLDLLVRHRGTLKYLDIGDVVLKEGTWHSFFERLKTLVADSLITAEGFQLGGECLALRAEHCLEGQHWVLDSLASPNKSLRDSFVEFIFWDGAFPCLHETGYSN